MQGNSHFLILSNFIAKSFDIVSIQKSNIIINKKLKISFAAKVAIRACGLGSKITTTRCMEAGSTVFIEQTNSGRSSSSNSSEKVTDPLIIRKLRVRIPSGTFSEWFELDECPLFVCSLYPSSQFYNIYTVYWCQYCATCELGDCLIIYFWMWMFNYILFYVDV